jgi:hypothetical protein
MYLETGSGPWVCEEKGQRAREGAQERQCTLMVSSRTVRSSVGTVGVPFAFPDVSGTIGAAFEVVSSLAPDWEK